MKIEELPDYSIIERLLQHKPRNVRSGTIYFVRTGDFVKIGFAKDLPRRMTALRIGCPHPLELILAIKGHIGVESEMHIRFEQYWHRGEWFRYEGELRSFVEANRTTNEQNL